MIALGAVFYVGAIILLDVFSWRGLAFSLFLTDAGTLRFPLAVRVVTDVGLLQVGVLTSMVLDYRDGRRQLEVRWAWLIAHITLVRRIARCVAWLAIGIVMLACELWRQLRRMSMPLPHALTDWGSDVRYGIGAVWTAAGRRRWRRYRHALRLRPLPDAGTFRGLVVEGSPLLAASPRTWRDVPSAPAHDAASAA